MAGSLSSFPPSTAAPASASPRPASSWKRSTAPAATPPPATPRCTPWAPSSATAAPSRKQRYLPRIAGGDLRLQAFGVTEPNAGSETTRIETTAVRRGDTYVVNGQKIFISRVLQSDLMLLLARTTPYDDLEDKTQGLSTFLVDLRDAGPRVRVQPLDIMFNQHTNAVFFDDLEIPAENLIGRGRATASARSSTPGTPNASSSPPRPSATAAGSSKRPSTTPKQRVVFGRPIGSNQGVQFPIAQAYAHVEAADLVRFRAAALFDDGQPCGAEANMAKLLASEASWEAANVCLNTHGGYGFAVDYDVERKFRETRLFSIAPVNNNLVLAFLGQRVLGLPRSY